MEIGGMSLSFSFMQVLTALIPCFLFLPAADAAIFYDVSVKGIYEDNVVGLLSDRTGGNASGTGPLSGAGTMSGGTMGSAQAPGMGPGSGSRLYTGSSSEKTGDTSMALAAELGGGLPITSRLSLFLAGSADRITYSSFTDLNMTAGTASSGAVMRLGDVLTARLAAGGAVKRFGDSGRDATSYSGHISFREDLSSSFWIKQSYLYERNSADSPYFTYSGSSLGIWAGFHAASRTMLTAGYHYLIRKYEEPAGFEETARTVSLGLEWEPVEKWFVDLQYDDRTSESSLDGTDTGSNIYSIGLRYSY